MTMFAGQLGTGALAAYSLSHNLMSTLFMVGLGLAVATGVRVGIETGRGRAAEAAFAGWTGMLAVFLLMGGLAALIFANRESIAWIYTDDPVVAARAAALFAVSALVFVPDCAQVVMGQALRALGDAWVAVGCYLLSFLILMVPLGWIAVHHLGYDERGLVGAILLSCVLATVLLAARFRWLTQGAGD
jgi:MATE family multidrug resistance protein